MGYGFSPQWVTSVPSLRNERLVKNFAQRLAYKLGLPYVEAIKKLRTHRSKRQWRIAFISAVMLLMALKLLSQILLKINLCYWLMIWLIQVDIYGMWLPVKSAGSGDVYPFALASTSKLEGGE